MAPRRILVTGASGFVGSHLIPVLRREFPEAEITQTTRGARPGFRTMDLGDRASVEAVVRDVRPDACVHLGGVAAIAVARERPDLAWTVNCHGAEAVAHAILRYSPECLLLYVSSADIYGASFRSGLPLNEDAPVSPINAYGVTKAAGGLALGWLAAEQGLRMLCLRPFNHTGPGQSADFVVPAFARQIARIEAGLQDAVIFTGDLEPKRDFLDVRDVCEAYAACLRSAPPPGTILNLASGTPRRVRDVLNGLIDLAGVQVRIERAAHLMRASDIQTAVGDATRARDVLGWRPKIPWEATLADVLTDWRERVGHAA